MMTPQRKIKKKGKSKTEGRNFQIQEQKEHQGDERQIKNKDTNLRQ